MSTQDDNQVYNIGFTFEIFDINSSGLFFQMASDYVWKEGKSNKSDIFGK